MKPNCQVMEPRRDAMLPRRDVMVPTPTRPSRRRRCPKLYPAWEKKCYKGSQLGILKKAHLENMEEYRPFREERSAKGAVKRSGASSALGRKKGFFASLRLSVRRTTSIGW